MPHYLLDCVVKVICERPATRAASMQWRLREFPRMFPDGRYPPNTLLIIDRLVGEQYFIEVQTVAAL